MLEGLAGSHGLAVPGSGRGGGLVGGGGGAGAAAAPSLLGDRVIGGEAAFGATGEGVASFALVGASFDASLFALDAAPAPAPAAAPVRSRSLSPEPERIAVPEFWRHVEAAAAPAAASRGGMGGASFGDTVLSSTGRVTT